MRFILFIWFLLLFSVTSEAQIAAGKCKFLGNIIKNSTAVPESFNTYWNQVTPENAGKWGEVEPIRDNMRWTNLDQAYHHAKDNGFPFRQHTLVWGQQQPGWIGGLSQADQRMEVEQWIKLFGERYPDADFIDVVNEPLHAVPAYSPALGGSGSTGWDWVVWTFEKARQYCPNARLFLNDYGIIGNLSPTLQYLEIIGILQEKELIDGIGIQGHGLESADTTVIRSNLDLLAATGLPIHLTEYDVNLSNDQQQFGIYFAQFPVFWEHPGVEGVTLWGYIEGQIWKPDAYLLRTDGSERPALSWLKTYVMSAIDIPCFPTGLSGRDSMEATALRIYPNPLTDGIIHFRHGENTYLRRIVDLRGRTILEFMPEASPKPSLQLDLGPGMYLMQFIDGHRFVSEKLLVK